MATGLGLAGTLALPGVLAAWLLAGAMASQAVDIVVPVTDARRAPITNCAVVLTLTPAGGTDSTNLVVRTSITNHTDAAGVAVFSNVVAESYVLTVYATRLGASWPIVAPNTNASLSVTGMLAGTSASWTTWAAALAAATNAVWTNALAALDAGTNTIHTNALAAAASLSAALAVKGTNAAQMVVTNGLWLLSTNGLQLTQLGTAIASNAPGVPGMVMTDRTNLYVCVETNSWKRLALAW